MPRSGSTTERGYGHEHRKLRKTWQPYVEAGEVDCARCHLPIARGQAWDLGHDDQDRSKWTGPEHRHTRDCPEGGNRATLTHTRDAATRSTEPVIRDW